MTMARTTAMMIPATAITMMGQMYTGTPLLEVGASVAPSAGSDAWTYNTEHGVGKMYKY